MATNPEAVGRLLANSALMNGERELLRRRDGPPAETSQSVSHQQAPPIATDNKAVTTVLLTLLDEQLHATEIAAAGLLSAQKPADSAVTASKLAMARYATDGFVGGDDPGLPQPMIGADQMRMQATTSVVSADLQTFVQRFAAFAAGRSLGAHENSAASRSGAGPGAGLFSRGSPLGVAGLAAVLLLLLAIIVQWAAR